MAPFTIPDAFYAFVFFDGIPKPKSLSCILVDSTKIILPFRDPPE